MRQHTSPYVSMRQHTSAYISMRQHTSAYARIRQHTSSYVSIREHHLFWEGVFLGGSEGSHRIFFLAKTYLLRLAFAVRTDFDVAEIELRLFYLQHTSVYVSIRQHASAFVYT
jgi:hypothetical protein